MWWCRLIDACVLMSHRTSPRISQRNWHPCITATDRFFAYGCCSRSRVSPRPLFRFLDLTSKRVNHRVPLSTLKHHRASIYFATHSDFNITRWTTLKATWRGRPCHLTCQLGVSMWRARLACAIARSAVWQYWSLTNIIVILLQLQDVWPDNGKKRK